MGKRIFGVYSSRSDPGSKQKQKQVCAFAIHVMVHCGSAFEPGASGLPYYCTSICVRSCCNWRASCVDSTTKKTKNKRVCTSHIQCVTFVTVTKCHNFEFVTSSTRFFSQTDLVLCLFFLTFDATFLLLCVHAVSILLKI